jgi:uncharacterized protein YdeI (YjbR/CyaY-like superfamily)
VTDRDPRAIDTPADLVKALRAARLLDTFARLAPSHRKEYVMWLEDAKRPETHERRLAKIVDAVREKYGAPGA